MLADRHQLEVGEAEVVRIGHQGLGEFVPAQEAVVGVAPPRAEMHLVDADRRVQGVGTPALCGHRRHRRQRAHHAGGGRPHLALQRERVGLQRQQAAVAGEQFVLVGAARPDARQEDLPDAALAAQAHRVAAAVPVVEVAHHADPRRVRRPDRERGAGHPFAFAHDRPQHLVGAQVLAFGQQPGVGVAEHRREAVRVLEHRAATVAPVGAQPVALAGQRQRALEEAVGMAQRQLAVRPVVGARQHLDPGRAGQEGAQPQPAVVGGMGAEHAERVGMARRPDEVDRRVLQHQAWDPGPVDGAMGRAGTVSMGVRIARLELPGRATRQLTSAAASARGRCEKAAQRGAWRASDLPERQFSDTVTRADGPRAAEHRSSTRGDSDGDPSR